jgi:ribosome maturation factor RimP
MTSPNSTEDLHGIDRVALDRVIDPIVRAHGAEVVDVEFKTERGAWVLRVSVEREGASERLLSTRDAAVNLELCANVSRDLSPALDVADLIQHPYQLEVSSPGVERVLRGERDFVRFAGNKAKLKLREAIGASPEGLGGQRVVIGMLDGVADGRVRVVESGHAREVPLAIVEKARLVFEFGSTGRPDKRKH